MRGKTSTNLQATSESYTTTTSTSNFYCPLGVSIQRPPDESTKGAVAATVAPVTPLLLELPTCLFIQTELCREETLYHWLRKHIRNRPRKTVLNYFDQVSGPSQLHSIQKIRIFSAIDTGQFRSVTVYYIVKSDCSFEVVITYILSSPQDTEGSRLYP